jgi:NAD-dependent DNA ligase
MEYEAIIRRVRPTWSFSNSLTKKVTVLVAPSVEADSIKGKTAKKYGIKMITYEQLEKMLGM